jgi:hypothetical protein
VAQAEFAWSGARDDLDLDRFWWHRLAKVTYVCILLAAVGITGLIIADGDGPNLEAKYDRIRFTANLNDLLSAADTGVPNKRAPRQPCT